MLAFVDPGPRFKSRYRRVKRIMVKVVNIGGSWSEEVRESADGALNTTQFTAWALLLVLQG